MLEIAELAVRLAMVPQRRSARLDRLLEHGADRLDQRMGRAGRVSRRVRQDAGRPQRRQPGAKQRFADVDIAEAGDPLLVEQRALQRRARAGEQLRQARGVEFRRERLRRRARSAGDGCQAPRSRRDP